MSGKLGDKMGCLLCSFCFHLVKVLTSYLLWYCFSVLCVRNAIISQEGMKNFKITFLLIVVDCCILDLNCTLQCLSLTVLTNQ
jgi:hypothetical protein